MLFRFAADYLKHQLSAKSRHGTHSPFVYKLVDEVIYDFSIKKVYGEIEQQRKKLLNDHNIITITDLGAGSRVNNAKQKEVAEIAKHALKRKRLSQLLYRLAKSQKPQNIIELGTSLGITTAYLAMINESVNVVSIEGCPETARVASDTFKVLDIKNVDLRIGNFDDILPEEIARQEKLDLVYIDGNHKKEATLNYFGQCLEKITENSLLIFDDIYWSTGMKEAWATIKSHQQVTVTVDLFWIGLVYFRKGQAKEDFKIRF